MKNDDYETILETFQQQVNIPSLSQCIMYKLFILDKTLISYNQNKGVNVMLAILAAICAGAATISSAVVSTIPVVGSAIVGATTAVGGAVGTATTLATSTVLGSASAASCGIIAGGTTTTALNVGLTETVIQSVKNINCN